MMAVSRGIGNNKNKNNRTPLRGPPRPTHSHHSFTLILRGAEGGAQYRSPFSLLGFSSCQPLMSPIEVCGIVSGAGHPLRHAQQHSTENWATACILCSRVPYFWEQPSRLRAWSTRVSGDPLRSRSQVLNAPRRVLRPLC